MRTTLSLAVALSLAAPAGAVEKAPPVEIVLPAARVPKTIEKIVVLPTIVSAPTLETLAPPSAPGTATLDRPAAGLEQAAAPGAIAPQAAAPGLDASAVSAEAEANAPSQENHDEVEAIRPTQYAPTSAEETTTGVDVSAEYQKIRAAIKKLRRPSGFAPRLPELAVLKEYKVLFVPGFLSGAFIKLSKAAGRDPRPWHYFGSQEKWLTAMGVEHELVKVHTEQSVEHNSRIVADAIRSSVKPVIIISHSKGGLDTLEALQHLRERGQLTKVAGWIPVQTPFLGSPGADRVVDQPLAHFWITRLLEHATIGGHRASIERMTTKISERYFQSRKRKIKAVLEEVPTVAFTSWKQVGFMDLLGELTHIGMRLNLFLNPWLLWSPLLGVALILKGVAGSLSWLATKSDGLVPAIRARLPGMEFVEEEGVDHFAPFVDHGGAFDRLEFTQALLKMLMGRIRGRARPEA